MYDPSTASTRPRSRVEAAPGTRPRESPRAPLRLTAPREQMRESDFRNGTREALKVAAPAPKPRDAQRPPTRRPSRRHCARGATAPREDRQAENRKRELISAATTDKPAGDDGVSSQERCGDYDGCEPSKSLCALASVLASRAGIQRGDRRNPARCPARRFKPARNATNDCGAQRPKRKQFAPAATETDRNQARDGDTERAVRARQHRRW